MRMLICKKYYTHAYTNIRIGRSLTTENTEIFTSSNKELLQVQMECERIEKWCLTLTCVLKVCADWDPLVPRMDWTSLLKGDTSCVITDHWLKVCVGPHIVLMQQHTHTSLLFISSFFYVCIGLSYYCGISIMDMKWDLWSTQRSAGHDNKHTMKVEWAEWQTKNTHCMDMLFI